MRGLALPHHLNLDHRADKAVEHYLIPVGQFVDNEEGPGLLSTLDGGVGPAALRRDNVRLGIWIIVHLGLEVDHDLLWGHGQQLGPEGKVL